MRKSLITLVLILLPFPVWAVPFGQYIDPLTKRCFSYTTDSERIRVCNALIGASAGHVPIYRSALYFARSDAYMHSGDWNHALADVGHSLDELGSVPNKYRIFVVLKRGEIYLKMGQSDLGKNDLLEVIANLSDEIPREINEVRHHVELFVLLQDDFNGRAWAHHLLGEDAVGLPDVMNAMEIYDKEPSVLETRAEIYEKLGKREQAIADYRASLALSPNFAVAKDGLARLEQGPAQ